MESAELIAEMRAQFEAWKVQVLRLAAKNKGQFETVNNTERVGGLTYEEILSTFEAEIRAHELQTNPHNLTLATLAGMARGTYNNLANSYYPRTGFPFTKAPKVSYGVVGQTMDVYGFSMMFMGQPIDIAGARFTVNNAARQYIKVVITGTPGAWVGTLTYTSSVAEDMRNVIVGHAALVGGVPQVVTTAVFRIGHATVTQTPRGLAIPASKGTPTLPRGLEPGWFAT